MAEIRKGDDTAGRRRRTIREHGPDPVDVHVGRRLRQARFLAGMSQEELGAGIGVSFQAVQKYEHGDAGTQFLLAHAGQEPRLTQTAADMHVDRIGAMLANGATAAP